MNTRDALERVTRRLSEADNSLRQVRELVDLEFITVPLRDLSDSKKVADFLNTLRGTDNEYVDFISNHFVYYLLRAASFHEPVPLGAPGLGDALALMEAVLKNLQSQKPPQETTETRDSSLNNSSVLTQVSQYLALLKALKLDQSFQVTPSPVIGTFRCIEELTLAFYASHWSIYPKVSLKPLNFQTQGVLEQWLLVSYLTGMGIPHDLPKVPSLKTLSKTLLTKEPGLFIPVSVVTETSLTLPLAKERAKEVFTSLDENIPSVKHTPIMAFRDTDLDSLSTDYLFLYDFVFEGICNSQIHSCTRRSIEGFLKRCAGFLTQMTNIIQTTCANKPSLALPKNERLREGFASCGLTQDSCNAFRTMMAISHPKADLGWKHLASVIQLLDQITLFGKFFFECLSKCSPTSISFRAVRDIIHGAYVEQSSLSSWLPNTIPFKQTSTWPIPPLLKIFVPRPPEKELISLFKAIPSNMGKSLFGIAAKRDWGLTKVYQLAKHNQALPKISKNPTPKQANKKQVQKFCDSLEIGDTEYPLEVVQSQYFATEFTRTKIVPVLQNILSNNASKHSILSKLKWLIIFAFDDALGLYQIRRPLSLAYFQLADIYGQNSSGLPLSHLLDNIQEVTSIIGDLVPDTPQLPVNFLSHIYRLSFSPLAVSLTQAADYFLKEMDPLLDGLWHMIRISSIMCHTVYHYDSSGRYMELQVEESTTSLRVPLEIFKKTLQTIELNVHETLVIMSQLCQDLHKSYVSCLTVIEKTQTLRDHPLKIDVSEPNFTLIQDSLLGCLKRYREILTLVRGNCCYSLTRYFGFIFESDLITEATIRQILDFSDDTDNPNIFIHSIQQPLEPQRQQPNSATSWPKLTLLDINTLKEIYEPFPSMEASQEITPSIKLSYTDTVNVSQINLDWDKLIHSEYLTQQDLGSNYSHITIKNLEQTITGPFS
ncbi:hypothetical protein [Rhinolophus gammaherpesvirus 1]|uniref:Inner tegument protein n=1 Tax=Rhinolophus gammaherpesvirus 1 TaxID=2054179 RepID=A0A2Z5U6E5_9GAMA|nr:hypothetical protein [Rhinolophus gammaherpesvirus 1]BBB06516.1 hypothetical protein [Rhinolophus gammaherpesvirus 1]